MNTEAFTSATVQMAPDATNVGGFYVSLPCKCPRLAGADAQQIPQTVNARLIPVITHEI